MSGATKALEGFESIKIEAGQSEFEVTYTGDAIDPEAIQAAVVASGFACQMAPKPPT